MGPKKHSPLEDPPAASSSSGEEEEEEEVSDTENQADEQKDEEPEEEEEEEEDEEESEDDEEKEKPVSQNSQKLPLTQPQPQPEASSSDDDSDSEPEPDPEKVIKPMETKKPAPPKPSKRPIESSRDGKSSKKSKTKEAAAPENEKKKGEESSKKLFQRLWSEEDEIAVLKGMIDYNSKKGLDPMSDVNGFYEFVKRSLVVDVTKAQAVDKVKRLRKKFVNNFGRGKKGEDPNFSRPHESKSYQLSKKIWGHLILNKSSNGKLNKYQGKPNVKEEGGEKEKKTNVKEEEVVSVKADEDIVMADVASEFCITELVKGGLDEAIVRQGLESLGHAKRAEFEDKWSSLKLAETELYVQRISLFHQHSKLIMDAYKLSRR